MCSYVLNHRCHHEFDALPKNVFSPYYLSTAGMKSPCLGNKCWSNTYKSHIRFVEMQLGGLSSAKFSKHSQLFASLHLAWFWIFSSNYLKCFNLQSCPWFLGRCLGEGELGGSSLLSLPFPPLQPLLERSTNAWIVVPHWRVCQNAAAGLEAAGKGVKGAHPSRCWAARWAPSSPWFPSSAHPCHSLGESSWKQTQSSNKGPDFHNHTCKNASAVA